MIVKNSQSGLISPLLLALLAVLLIGGGAYVYVQNKQANQPVAVTQTTQATSVTSGATSTVATSVVSYNFNGFSPSSVVVPLGGTVRFVNQSTKGMWVASDPHPTHTAYDGTSLSQHCPGTTNSSFDECAALAPSVVSADNPYNAPSSFPFTFNKEGTWKYHNHLNPSQTGTIIVADASFHFLGDRSYFNTPDSAYAVDSTHAYYDGKPLGADAATLEILKGSLTNMKSYISYLYARDSRTVYYAGEPLPGAVSATFQPIENGMGAQYYGTDGRTVYFGSKPIVGADPKTFKILWQTIYEGCGSTNYSKDATHVYLTTFGTTKSIVTVITVPSADPATFEPLINGFGKDNRGYYNEATYIGSTLDKEKLVCNYG